MNREQQVEKAITILCDTSCKKGKLEQCKKLKYHRDCFIKHKEYAEAILAEFCHKDSVLEKIIELEQEFSADNKISQYSYKRVIQLEQEIKTCLTFGEEKGHEL